MTNVFPERRDVASVCVGKLKQPMRGENRRRAFESYGRIALCLHIHRPDKLWTISVNISLLHGTKPRYAVLSIVMSETSSGMVPAVIEMTR